MTASGVSCGEDVPAGVVAELRGGGDGVGVSGVDHSARGFSDVEGIRGLIFAAGESGGDEEEFAREGFLCSFDRDHHEPSGFFVLFGFELDGDDCFEFAVVVFQEFFDGCGVDSRVVTVEGDGFLLAVVGLADAGPLRPRVVRGALVRGFGHHFEVED